MAADQDIAVIGIACRFPGNADCPENLWKLMLNGELSWSEFPKDRMNIDGFYHPHGGRQGSISFRGAHFIKSDITAFDAQFFGISSEEAKAVDPQQRFLLEVSYEALENAGLKKEDLDGSDTSVFVGSFVKDYEQVCLRDPDYQPQYAATGNGVAIMSNRLSYYYNFHGASMTIDTGCSASLVAVDLAIQTLLSGQSSIAMAAGAGMILTPNTMMPMTALNFLSPDGRCFSFDERANGYGRGEGVGVVVLKKLADALRDRDPIRAVIRKTRVNQDGRSQGITHPNLEAQASNIRSIYAEAGLDFSQTAYVECHGTGTQAGDFTELSALSQTLAKNRNKNQAPLYVGSVKANIGHLEGAAGIAGLIKAILVVENGIIPPVAGFRKGNPKVDFDNWNINVPTIQTPWPIKGLRRASVNCFGFGGTNAHLILDQAPKDEVPSSLTTTIRSMVFRRRSSVSPAAKDRLFVFSASDRAGIARLAKSHAAYLCSRPQCNFDDSFCRDYVYTLACRRSNLYWKAFYVAESLAQITNELENVEKAQLFHSSTNKPPKICFAFCGQGAQLPAMGLGLFVFGPFRESIQAAEVYMASELGSPFRLIEEMKKPEKNSRIRQPEIAQPATTAMQVAMVDLLRYFGICPEVVVGHSSGEIAAAYAAGLVDRETAWAVAYYRGYYAGVLRAKAPSIEGGMLVVKRPLADVEAILAKSSIPVVIACYNSPESVTLSGRLQDLVAIQEILAKSGDPGLKLDVPIAYHSSFMEYVALPYNSSLQAHKYRHTSSLRPSRKPVAKMYSSLTGQLLKSKSIESEYWVENMTSPVRFTDAVEAMVMSGTDRPDLIIEISPRRILQSLVGATTASLKIRPIDYHQVCDRTKSVTKSLLEVVGHAWAKGCQVDMKHVMAESLPGDVGPRTLTDLPTYSWNHSKSFWHESHLGEATRFRQFPRQDLIGSLSAETTPCEPRWRGFLRISECPWLQDHQVQKLIVYPAAGMATMVIEAASQLVSSIKEDIAGFEILNMQICKAMIIPETAHGLEVSLGIKQDSTAIQDDWTKGVHEFTVSSKSLDGPWGRNASGLLRIIAKTGKPRFQLAVLASKHEKVLDECKVEIAPRQLYENLDIIGMNYGSTFQNLSSIRKGPGACAIRIKIPDTKSKMPSGFEYPHIIHPGTLDAVFHSLFAIDSRPMVPTYITRLFVASDIQQGAGNEFDGYATAQECGVRDVVADISMTSNSWTSASVVVEGLKVTQISGHEQQAQDFIPNHRNLCSQVVWEEDFDTCREQDLDRLIELAMHKYPDLAILQVGGCNDTSVIDTVLSHAQLHQTDPIRLSRYTFTGNSTAAFDAMTNSLANSPFRNVIEQRVLDDFDGLEEFPHYHIIVSYGQQHEGFPSFTTDQLQSILKPEGLVLLKGNQQPDAASALQSFDTQQMLGGLWAYRPKRLFEFDCSTKVNLILPTQRVLGSAKAAQAVVEELKARLIEGGILVKTSKLTDYRNDDDESSLCIMLGDFGGAQANRFFHHMREQEFVSLQHLQRKARGILWVTRGAQMKSNEPTAAAAYGLTRTLMSEDPQKRIVMLDLAMHLKFDETAAASTIQAAFYRNFIAVSSGTPETEYAEEGGKLYVPRLVPMQKLNASIEQGSLNYRLVEKPFLDMSAHLRLKIDDPKLSAGSYHFKTAPMDTTALGDFEVEIEFHKTILHKADVDTMMGATVDTILGMDFYGMVTKVGRHVVRCKLGDNVVAFVADGCIQNRIRLDQAYVQQQVIRPGATTNLLFIPSAHITAFCALGLHGRISSLSKHKAVLIHEGTSVYGQAAIQMALVWGVKIFATVVQDEDGQQRKILSEMIPREHILDAEDDEHIAAMVRERTGGKGVDVLFDPNQTGVNVNTECVGKTGWVIRVADRLSSSPLSKRSRYPSRITKYAEIDLREIFEHDPSFFSDLWLNASGVFSGHLPLPAITEQAEFCLSTLHNGLLDAQNRPALGITSVMASPKKTKVMVKEEVSNVSVNKNVQADGTYILVGGLGGLGRQIARLLVSQGAKNLAFFSRSGSAGSPEAASFIDEISRQDVRVFERAVDICDLEALKHALNDLAKALMPPIKGVVQCAAVIKDAVFDNMSYQDWKTAYEPKAIGSWNLLQALQEGRESDRQPWVLFLSSSAGVIGNRSQANYAAGNCVQDALARDWRSRGCHAVSLDLGPVLEAGMLADDEQILTILRASGFFGIRLQDFLHVVDMAIRNDQSEMPMPSQVVMAIGTGGLIRQNKPADPFWSRSPLYRLLNIVDMPPADLYNSGNADVNNEPDNSHDLRGLLEVCESVEEATEVIEQGLVRMLAKSMSMLPEEVDANKAPNAYGVDSLVAVGVRSWLITAVGVEVSVLAVVGDGTVRELAELAARKGGFGGQLLKGV